MAKINLYIPEPQPVYTQDSIRQINQALETLKDQLNFSFQEELKQELERFNWYNVRYGC
jgi:CCR4-NOT transcriptional regulation complex NOT5 subunit